MMADAMRIDPAKIAAANKLLRDLPVKDGKKSMEEALVALEVNLLTALDKGYDQHEVRNLLAISGVPASRYALKKFLDGKKGVAPDEKNKQPGEKNELSDEKTEKPPEKITLATVKKMGAEGKKFEALAVKPDTPDNEL
jgi:hypothetical protein